MNLNKYIDHTLLKPESTTSQIAALCEEARQYDFASVCVNPTHVKYCSELLKGSDVKVCTVIGFPLGANTAATKAFETKDAINNGAEEIDMVLNIGALKEGNLALVKEDIKAVKDAANNAGGAVNGFMGVGMMNMASGGMVGGAATGAFQNQGVTAKDIGADGSSEPAKTEETATTEGTGAKFCPNCGTATNGAKFCSNCGNKLA